MCFTEMKIYRLVIIVFFAYAFFVYSLSSASATAVLELEDTRSRTVAVLLTYIFLNSDLFYKCITEWLEKRSPAKCNQYVGEVTSIAKDVKNLKITSPEDENFNQAISMFISASDAARPYCSDWHNGHRPGVCFKLILTAIKAKWWDSYQKVTSGSIISGKPFK